MHVDVGANAPNEVWPAPHKQWVSPSGRHFDSPQANFENKWAALMTKGLPLEWLSNTWTPEDDDCWNSVELGGISEFQLLKY